MTVTDINDYREKQDQISDEWDAVEEDLLETAMRFVDRFSEDMGEQYGVDPTVATEAMLLAIMGRTTHLIFEHDDPSCKDLLNYCNEISASYLHQLSCQQDRDSEERLAWREELYAHRETPPAKH